MSEKKHKVVYLGLSGGVDSAVAGYLLKQQGYKVEAVFMQNWDDDNNEDCTNDQDLVDAKNISEHLSIPFRVVNFAKNYWQDVFEKFLDAPPNLYERVCPSVPRSVRPYLRCGLGVSDAGNPALFGS